MLRRPALALLLGAVAACGSSTGRPAASPTARPAPTASGATTSVPVSAAVSVAVPTLPPLPADRAGADACATASSPLIAAATYVGLAELGRVDEAQRCVRGDAVPRTATAALTVTDTSDLFVPVPGPNTSAVRLRQPVTGRTVTVTVSLVDGRYYAVTALRP